MLNRRPLKLVTSVRDAKPLAIPEDDPIQTKPSEVRRLLTLIISQALHDGMSSVEFGLSSDTNESFMRYYGPKEATQQQWWDMVPPPRELYGKLFQTVISSMTIETASPTQGWLDARHGRDRMRITFTMENLNSFRLTWT